MAAVLAVESAAGIEAALGFGSRPVGVVLAIIIVLLNLQARSDARHRAANHWAIIRERVREQQLSGDQNIHHCRMGHARPRHVPAQPQYWPMGCCPATPPAPQATGSLRTRPSPVLFQLVKKRLPAMDERRARSDVPGGTGIGEDRGSTEAGAVHFPDRDGAAAVLPQDVGLAVMVVVAGPHDVPIRPRVADAAAADRTGAVQAMGLSGTSGVADRP